MSYRYDALLSPIKIGDAVIKNRTMYPNASPHFLQGPETYPADSFMTFMGGLARNGAAIITLAEWSNPGQRSAPLYLVRETAEAFGPIALYIPVFHGQSMHGNGVQRI